MHFAKKNQHPKATINYLGRYLKRPPISGTKLAHYRGEGNLSFRYLNHHTGKYETEHVTQLDLIKRLIQHIPDKDFKIIRYYGFLSNRRRGEALPKVYVALEITAEESPKMPGYAMMLKGCVLINPYECILCHSRLVFVNFRAGEPLKGLVLYTMTQSELRSA